MKLLIEQINDFEFLTESDTSGKKNHYIQGIFLQADLKNRNGRIYPERILENEVNRYRREKIETHRALGELSHSTNTSVDPNLASHKITSLVKEGKNFIGKALVLSTPKGQIIKSLLDDGVSLGVSSKGLGSLTPRDGCNYVGEDYKLVTAADCVLDPSAPDAYVSALMESTEYIMDDNGIIREYRDTIKNAKTKAQLEEAKIQAFTKLIRSL
jgi:hypothetical protein